MTAFISRSALLAAAFILVGCASQDTTQPKSTAPVATTRSPPASEPPPPRPPSDSRGAGWETPPRCAAPYRGAGAARRSASEHEIGTACIALIRRHEGLRLNAYPGTSGRWLIGYGHAGVSRGDKITKEQAEDLLRNDLELAAREVRKMLKEPVTANEFSALTCLAYNIGYGRLSRDSTMRAVNNGQYEKAGDEITTLRRTRSGGPIVAHLVDRRQEECALFRAL